MLRSLVILWCLLSVGVAHAAPIELLPHFSTTRRWVERNRFEYRMHVYVARPNVPAYQDKECRHRTLLRYSEGKFPVFWLPSTRVVMALVPGNPDEPERFYFVYFKMGDVSGNPKITEHWKRHGTYDDVPYTLGELREPYLIAARASSHKKKPGKRKQQPPPPAVPLPRAPTPGERDLT